MAWPKYVVSLPEEPAPLEETVNPWLLRKICSCLTSDPVMPCFKFLVNEPIAVGVVVGFEVGVYEELGAQVKPVGQPGTVGVTATPLSELR